MKIEKNIPLPGRRREMVFTLQRCKVGDSFVADCRNQSYPYSAALAAGVRIRTHKEEDGKYRVWRVA
jgi:hypothetical protein